MEYFLILLLVFLIILAFKLIDVESQFKNKLIEIELLKSDHQSQIDFYLDQLTARNKEIDNLKMENSIYREEVDELHAFKGIRDINKEAERIKREADQMLADAQESVIQLLADANQQASSIISNAEVHAESIRVNSNLDAKNKKEKIEALLKSATKEASQIIINANQQAVQIAGDAYDALKNANQLKDIAKAMQNVIDGYGDKYIKPTFSLLDELAAAYEFDEAGQQLKVARERTKLMVEHQEAASCDYVEKNRRDTAVRFVVDAFNGKVDSILTRAKVENYGVLEQQILDAFSLVNFNGTAFRNAVITEHFLNARLNELKWLVAVNLVREKEKEEQKVIRERIREEEKARREIERALKEAAQEEAALQKAMERVQAQVDKANHEQKRFYLDQLEELQERLRIAEEKSQRALSMAQQTKAGHVYIISNVGSFGESIYKVGMTRRLEPLDRVKELGDASVPFPFDVHAMIWSENAPALENDLHKHYVTAQVNKVNPRKEFFKLSISDLKQHIESLGYDATWTIHSNAAEYRESLIIDAKIKENSPLANEWLRNQLKYDALPEEITETIEAN